MHSYVFIIFISFKNHYNTVLANNMINYYVVAILHLCMGPPEASNDGLAVAWLFWQHLNVLVKES